MEVGGEWRLEQEKARIKLLCDGHPVSEQKGVSIFYVSEMKLP